MSESGCPALSTSTTSVRTTRPAATNLRQVSEARNAERSPRPEEFTILRILPGSETSLPPGSRNELGKLCEPGDPMEGPDRRPLSMLPVRFLGLEPENQLAK